MKINLVIILTVALSAGIAEADSSPMTIGVLADGETEFWASVRDAMQDAAKEQNATLDFRMTAPATVERQQELVLEMMAKGISAIAISPINPEEQLKTLQELAEKIPLVALMRDVPDSKRALFIGRDEKQVGQLLGQSVLDNIPPGVKVMAFCKNPESPETKARIEGLKEVFDASETVLDSTQADQGDRMIAGALMEEMIKKHPEITALIGLEAYHGSAMIHAVTATGRVRMVRVIGFGRTPEMEVALREGVAQGLVCDDAAGWGALLFKTLAALAKGDKEGIPEGGFIAAPLKTLQTESSMTTEEMMHEIQVQVPWISEVAPGTN